MMKDSKMKNQKEKNENKTNSIINELFKNTFLTPQPQINVVDSTLDHISKVIESNSSNTSKQTKLVIDHIISKTTHQSILNPIKNILERTIEIPNYHNTAIQPKSNSINEGISKKYDIFISFKKSDPNSHESPNHNLTKDYFIANELCLYLKNKGFHVFFSEASLKEMGTSAYHKKINEALDQADILIFVCTNPEYAKSSWVDYELSTFHQESISKGKKMFNLLDDVNTQDLPIQIRYHQTFFYRSRNQGDSEGIVQLGEFLINHFQGKH
jgi:hypothetical protein